MLGGYQILDLRKIDLTITKTQSTITDAYVLSQLLKLRDFIDKDYDFSKPIENQLKPVLIRYRDKKSGEKSEGAMFGELAVVDNYYTFKITGRISGALILTIKVAFQEITNAYGAKEWVINTAKIQLQDVIEDLEGNLALEGDLDVSGDVDVGGDLEVVGNAVLPEINGEENPSVKPLYWHGIEIYMYDDNHGATPCLHFTLVIINNSATPIDNFEDLLDMIIAFGNNAFINLGGYYDVYEAGARANVCSNTGLWRNSLEQIVYIGSKYDCTRYTNAKSKAEWLALFNQDDMEQELPASSIEDRVNKLN